MEKRITIGGINKYKDAEKRGEEVKKWGIMDAEGNWYTWWLQDYNTKQPRTEEEYALMRQGNTVVITVGEKKGNYAPTIYQVDTADAVGADTFKETKKRLDEKAKEETPQRVDAPNKDDVIANSVAVKVIKDLICSGKDDDVIQEKFNLAKSLVLTGKVPQKQESIPF